MGKFTCPITKKQTTFKKVKHSRNIVANVCFQSNYYGSVKSGDDTEHILEYLPDDEPSKLLILNDYGKVKRIIEDENEVDNYYNLELIPSGQEDVLNKMDKSQLWKEDLYFYLEKDKFLVKFNFYF